jgi:hypothetical protein
LKDLTKEKPKRNTSNENRKEEKVKLKDIKNS